MTPTRPKARPLSPFMIGPYYRPQLTSVTSIMHRITGVILSVAALVLCWWLVATASGPDSHAHFAAFAGSLPGQALAAATVFAIVYHWVNGLRHLGWDAGIGMDLRTAYASGWATVAISAVLTVALWLVFLGGGA
jgi:succinate dehydrogenase / fumarate reductase cytochrome b subunit